MNRARSFFFVCLGILCLAITYHLGARSAGAQGQLLEGPRTDGGTWTASVNRTLWVVDGAGLRQVGPTIPGTSPVVATAGGGLPSSGGVLLANGDCYLLTTGASEWQLYGSLLGGSPTPAQSISVGQLKAKYATPAGE